MEEKDNLEVQSSTSESTDVENNQNEVASSNLEIENVEITSDKNVIKEEEPVKTNKKIKVLLISVILLIIVVTLTFVYVYFFPINKADL